MNSEWLSLGAKVLATMLVVVTASVVAERSGPFWGGLVASLPVVAGPSYLLLAMQADADFVARSALSSFTALSAIALFLLVLVKAAPRTHLATAFAAATFVWLAAAALLLKFPPGLLAGLLLNLAVFSACWALTHEAWTFQSNRVALPRRWFDVPLRALLIGCFVAGVIAASLAIGQVATGIAVMFPISLGSLYVLVHARLGGRAAATAMAGAVRAIGGLGAALLVLHLTTRPWGTPLALVSALAVSLVWWGGVVAWNVQRIARTRERLVT
jgi:hypothetical protein